MITRDGNNNFLIPEKMTKEINPSLKKQTNTRQLVSDYCKKHLNEEYRKLCLILLNDICDSDEDFFKRGKEDIWAASIIWAIGSVNFLSDKTFEPYATLSEICNYFDTKTSTVGQKAGKLRDMFDMNYFNDRYQREESGIADIFGKLLMTDEGFIIPANWQESNDPEDGEIIDDEEGEELPGYYTIILTATNAYKRAEIFQLEYVFKSLLEKDEKFQHSEFLPDRKIHINFYGRPGKIRKFEYHHLPGKFTILDVIDQSET